MSSDYGTYRLSYTPPASTGEEDYPNIAIEMTTGGDASVTQMLQLFEAFLSAAGYILKGDLQIVEEKAKEWEPEFSTTAPYIAPTYDWSAWGDDGFSLVGNPIYGASGSDILTLG